MKTLIFSDTHLGPRFEEKKFNFLKTRILEADKVIINGDFWEGYLYSFQQFINSPWSLLFPFLKKKGAVYLFGNHDKRAESDREVDLFSVHHAEQYRHVLNGTTLVLEHGDRICKIAGDDSDLKRNKRLELMTRIADRIERVFTRNGLHNYKRHLLGKYNKTIKEQLDKELKSHEIFVCGHTHLAEFNTREKFINSGIVKHGVAQYLIINDKTIIPKEEWYE